MQIEWSLNKMLSVCFESRLLCDSAVILLLFFLLIEEVSTRSFIRELS